MNHTPCLDLVQVNGFLPWTLNKYAIMVVSEKKVSLRATNARDVSKDTEGLRYER